MMKNPQPNKAFLTIDTLRNILNDDTIKGKNLRVVFADYPVRNDELAAELLNITGFTVDGRKEVINELVIYADRYETSTPQKPKNPNKKTPLFPAENEDWEEVESLENKDPFSF
mgnify:CR=1 FL=1|jgi:hypothetical protein